MTAFLAGPSEINASGLEVTGRGLSSMTCPVKVAVD